MPRLRDTLYGKPIVSDAFYTPTHNLIVLSPERMDDAGRSFARYVQSKYQAGWNREELLKGKVPNLKAGETLATAAEMMTLALVDKAVEEELIVSQVTPGGEPAALRRQRAHRPAPGAAGVDRARGRQPAQQAEGAALLDRQQPRAVHDRRAGVGVRLAQLHPGPPVPGLPEQEGAEPGRRRAADEHPDGQVLRRGARRQGHRPVAPAAAAGGGADRRPRRGRAARWAGRLRRPAGRRVRRRPGGPGGRPGFGGPPGRRAGGFGEPGEGDPGGFGPPGFGRQQGGNPNQPDPVTEQRNLKAKLERKAQVTAWALTFFLAKKKMPALLAFYAELNQMPRDMRLDRTQVLHTFCRVMGLMDPNDPTQINKEEFKRFAEDWVGFLRVYSSWGIDLQVDTTVDPGSGINPGGTVDPFGGSGGMPGGSGDGGRPDGS